MNANTKQIIIGEIAKAFIPLKDALSTNSDFEQFMDQLGWSIDTIPPPIANLSGDVLQLESSLTYIVNNTATNSDYVQVATDLVQLVININGLSNEDFSAYPQLGSTFAPQFPKQLVDYLIIKKVSLSFSRISSVLKILGIFRVQQMTGTLQRPSYYAHEILWNNLGKLISDPKEVFRELYFWGNKVSLMFIIKFGGQVMMIGKPMHKRLIFRM